MAPTHSHPVTDWSAPAAAYWPVPVYSVTAIAAGAACGVGLALAAGWQPDVNKGHRLESAASAWAGAAPVAVGAFISAVVLASPAARTLSRLGPVVMATGVLRLLVALTCVVGVYLQARPEPKTCATAFLASALLLLVAETVWATLSLKRVTAGKPPASGVRA